MQPILLCHSCLEPRQSSGSQLAQPGMLQRSHGLLTVLLQSPGFSALQLVCLLPGHHSHHPAHKNLQMTQCIPPIRIRKWMLNCAKITQGVTDEPRGLRLWHVENRHQRGRASVEWNGGAAMVDMSLACMPVIGVGSKHASLQPEDGPQHHVCQGAPICHRERPAGHACHLVQPQNMRQIAPLSNQHSKFA